ncbi:MAG: 2-oxoacid:acceptor oxidoreductase family protein [Elusimicrobiota bacterium]|nr:2-oxoacid:acceptor oxidoreductase family protein [Elusimicrobiota bacterium]MDH5662107.1 2-oxoacid:acceptor oxidoreductase family protein [Elusimicrobiota bacterium]
MKEEIIVAGYGGQGIMFAGTLLAHAAMEEGLNVTCFPSYGAEMRGGTANCKVIISDESIGSPIVTNPSTLLAMNETSLQKFASRVRKGGLIVTNSSLLKKEIKTDDVEILNIPATELAEKLGDGRVANMVILGVYVNRRKIVSLERTMDSLSKVLGEGKKNLLKLNREALRKGEEYR